MGQGCISYIDNYSEEVFQSSISCFKFSIIQVLYLHIEYVWVWLIVVCFFLLPPSILKHLKKLNVISPNASHVKVKSRSCQFKQELATTTFCPRVFLLLSYTTERNCIMSKRNLSALYLEEIVLELQLKSIF